MSTVTTQRIVTQQELHDEGAAILDAVESGESVLVTRDGVPIAELRPARRKREMTTEALQKIFAASPAPDYNLMRAEADEYFGEDRIGDAE